MRLPAYGANPAFSFLFEDLDLRITGIREELAMLFHTQIARSQQDHHRALEGIG